MRVKELKPYVIKLITSAFYKHMLHRKISSFREALQNLRHMAHVYA